MTRKQEQEVDTIIRLPDFLENPTKKDMTIWGLFILTALFGFAMIPLRIWFINNPEIYALAIGGYTSSVLLGNQQYNGNTSWYYLPLTLIGALKFFPIYYIMAQHWGRKLIDFLLSTMPKSYQKAGNKIINSKQEKIRTWSTILMPLTFIPGIRIGILPVILLMVLSEMKKKWIALISITSVLTVNGTFFYLGTLYGEQVTNIIEIINKYSLWISILLIAYLALYTTKTIQQQAHQQEETDKEQKL